jgi:hypothetical protein
MGSTGTRPAASSRYRFQKPLRSDTTYSLPSGAHTGWHSDSAGPPATHRACVSVPSSATAASHSSVPSQGMRGWFQLSHARRRPSGETRADA